MANISKTRSPSVTRARDKCMLIMPRRSVTSRHIGRRSIRDRFKSDCLQMGEAPESFFISGPFVIHMYTPRSAISRRSGTTGSATSPSAVFSSALSLTQSNVFSAFDVTRRTVRFAWRNPPPKKKLSFLPGLLFAERGRQEILLSRKPTGKTVRDFTSPDPNATE